MIKNQLNTIVRNSTTCLQMIEAGRKFPEWAQSEIAVAEDGIVSVTEFMESHQTALGEDSKLDEAVATPAVKKLIDGIDNLSPKEYFNFLQMLSNHATDTSNAAQPVNGVSNGLAWYQVSKHIGAAAKAYSERPVKMNEAQNMGTATIVDTGNKSGLDGKQANIFHKFDDGRINVQYKKSDRKGDVRNLTLNKGQYKLNEAVTTTNVKKLIDDIDDLSKEEFKQFLLAFADHMDETSKYARTNTGASIESIKAVSTYLYSAAKAFKI